jgi:hypothetical protein
VQSKLPEDQRNAQLAVGFPPDVSFDDRPISSTVVQTQDLLLPGLVSNCLDLFFVLGMHDEENYKHDPLDISRKRVLYWLLFIDERCAILGYVYKYNIKRVHS